MTNQAEAATPRPESFKLKFCDAHGLYASGSDYDTLRKENARYRRALWTIFDNYHGDDLDPERVPCPTICAGCVAAAALAGKQEEVRDGK